MRLEHELGQRRGTSRLLRQAHQLTLTSDTVNVLLGRLLVLFLAVLRVLDIPVQVSIEEKLMGVVDDRQEELRVRALRYLLCVGEKGL